jgi:hypothetical protein
MASHIAPPAPTAISSRSHLRVPSLRSCGLRRAADGWRQQRDAFGLRIPRAPVGVDLRLAQQQQRRPGCAAEAGVLERRQFAAARKETRKAAGVARRGRRIGAIKHVEMFEGQARRRP